MLQEKIKTKVTCWQSFKKSINCLLFDPKTCCCKGWYDMSEKVKVLVESNLFMYIIVTLILLNSLTLATEHYDQPDWLTDV